MTAFTVHRSPTPELDELIVFKGRGRVVREILFLTFVTGKHVQGAAGFTWTLGTAGGLVRGRLAPPALKIPGNHLLARRKSTGL